MRIFKLLFCVAVFTAFGQLSFGQESDIDRLSTLYMLQDYYSAQIRKDYVKEEEKKAFKEKLAPVEKEIEELHSKVRSNSDPDSDEIADIDYREVILEDTKEAPPAWYSSEPGSWLISPSVSYLGKNFSTPIALSIEKQLNYNWSVGIYGGIFTENNRTVSSFPEDKSYLKIYQTNYKYRYANGGLKATYHFFNIEKPVLNLNPQKVDLYGTLILGYNNAYSEEIFLDNGANSGQEPSLKGPNYGIFGGIRYYPEPEIGAFLEVGYANTAFVNAGFTIRLLPFNSDIGVEEEEEVLFKVNIYENKRKQKSDSKKFKGRTDVEEFYNDETNLYMYLVGAEEDYARAEALKAELIKAKLKKSYIVAFVDGEITPVKKAQKILKKRSKRKAKAQKEVQKK